MAVPTLLCGSETWFLQKMDYSRIQEAGTKFVRPSKDAEENTILRMKMLEEIWTSPQLMKS